MTTRDPAREERCAYIYRDPRGLRYRCVREVHPIGMLGENAHKFVAEKKVTP